MMKAEPWVKAFLDSIRHKGEMTMSEKLTRDWLEKQVCVHYPNMSEIWERIESDREAIRAETRAEVLKSAFELGERVEIEKSPGEWLNGIIMATASGAHFSTGGYNVRRPPKMRPMRPNEIQEALVKFVKTCDQESFNHLVVVSGIPTEIEES